MNKKFLVLFLVLVLILSIAVGCNKTTDQKSEGNNQGTQQPAEEITYQYMQADELKTIVTESKSEYIVLDVRKKADYDAEHIKGSISADVDSIVSNSDNAPAKENMTKVLSELDVKDKKFVLLCYSGKRYAQAATQLLLDAGIDAANIYTLEGGYKGWTFTDLFEK